MKHKLLKQTILATALVFLTWATSFAQCDFTVTDEQPFIEDFEGNGFDCWTVEDVVGGGNWTAIAGSGTTLAAFSFSNAGDEARLISPVLDISGVAGATFSFSYAMMGIYDYDELVVSYRSSETDDWHTLGTYSLSDYSNFYEETFTLTDLSATYQVSFLGRGLGGYMIFIDNIEISSVAGCARPVSLQADEITAFSALLHWSTTGNEESWTLDVDGHELIIDTQPYLMENLEPQTLYTFRVKANCGDGMESEWAVPITFKTLCDVIVVTDDEPYFDDFEASEDFLCWQNEIVYGIDGWVVDPGYLEPNNTAFFIWLGGAARLISAPLDITTVTQPTLTFKRKQWLGQNNLVDELSVWYRPSENDAWQMLGVFNDATADWVTESFALPNPSASYQINFEAVGMNANGIYVDEVKVGKAHTTVVTENVMVKASVTPNPTTGRVQVVANISNGDVAVYDLFGKKIASASVINGRAELDLSGFANGIYMARVFSETSMTTIKLVKE